jgi:hypothetical protein
MTTYRPPRERVEEVLAAFSDCACDARGVAEILIDEDVSSGDYEGCSTELELAFTEYERIAEDVLAARSNRRRAEFGRARAAHNQRLHDGGV